MCNTSKSNWNSTGDEESEEAEESDEEAEGSDEEAEESDAAPKRVKRKRPAGLFFLLIIGDVLLCVCMLVLHIYISIYTPRRHTSCIAIGALM
jgi:hypothetical protein